MQAEAKSSRTEIEQFVNRWRLLARNVGLALTFYFMVSGLNGMVTQTADYRSESFGEVMASLCLLFILLNVGFTWSKGVSRLFVGLALAWGAFTVYYANYMTDRMSPW